MSPRPIPVRRLVVISIYLSLALCWKTGAYAAAADDPSVANLSLEDLTRVEVTTVSRKAQSLQDTAAAAFVVTNEDIRRSGATSIPDVLRMVPGVQVAKLANDKWAVTARGFAGEFANKLLVMIDGRTIYSPLFSGVMWEAQDMLLQDIDHIEVVRGPGAALWGANAVNGVINIITKKASDTQGGMVELLAGNVEQGTAAFRYGAALDEDTHYRIYAKTYRRDAAVNHLGPDVSDGSESSRLGFRMDRRLNAGDKLTMSGAVYEARSSTQWTAPQVLPPYTPLVSMKETNRGAYLLARYDWGAATGAATALQVYLDSSHLAASPFVYEQRDTLDVDFQRQSQLGPSHDLIWGLNYRYSRDTLNTPGFINIVPAREAFRLFSLFVHDDITLIRDRLRLIAGAKLEYNSFTGMEPQPNLRLLWTPAPNHSIWTSFSRAVRVPSRSERNSTIELNVVPPFSAANPAPFPLLQRSTFQPGVERVAERLNSLEFGYRAQLEPNLSLDLTLFSNHYTRLRSVSLGLPSLQLVPTPYLLVPAYLDNGLSADTAGIEASVDWRPLSRWRLQSSYSLLRMSFPASSDVARSGLAQAFAGSSPAAQLSLRSALDITSSQQFDLWLRHVSSLASGNIPAYTTLDARYGWRLRKDLELSFIGQNLLQSRHSEFSTDFVSAPVLDVRRGFYLRAQWRY